MFYKKYFKRFQDMILSTLALIILSPIFIVVALMVKINLGSPVIFKQKRPGKNNIIFEIYKFRTMTNERDNQGNLLPNEQRLTSFGKWLRSTSLDELPALINIINGDMAIVGPRPLLVDYLPLYNEFQKRRHEVRPGFTGLAQVNGRNLLSWDEKFAYDVSYVDNISFLNDWVIIFKTIKSVFIKEGISSETNVTMERFTGND